jgi:formamidopyrimidine-DNA glycosylase
MPELPEVETVRRDLVPRIVGRTLAEIHVGERSLRVPWDAGRGRTLIGHEVSAIDRRGKYLFARFAGDVGGVMLHLGMTGQLTVHASDEPIADHVHLRFAFADGDELRFRDVRRFGFAQVMTADEWTAYTETSLGPEPTAIDAVWFFARIFVSKRTLKAILLDQTVIAGIGNIYADESCFRAGLHPGRRGESLSGAEIDALRQAIATVIERAIAGRGSTIRDYIGGSGLMGTYQGEFKVYGRAGDACEVCGSVIEMVRLAGRSSHFCPHCQPLQRPRRSRKKA